MIKNWRCTWLYLILFKKKSYRRGFWTPDSIPISINRRRGRLRASFICDRGRRCSGIGEGSVFRAAISWFDLSADVHSRGWWHGNNPKNRETSCQRRGDVWRRRPDVDTTSRNARGGQTSCSGFCADNNHCLSYWRSCNRDTLILYRFSAGSVSISVDRRWYDVMNRFK